MFVFEKRYRSAERTACVRDIKVRIRVFGLKSIRRKVRLPPSVIERRALSRLDPRK